MPLWCRSPNAQKKGVDYEFDNEKPWAEIQAELPPYPQTENLLKFDAGPASENSHYVDAPSISRGRGRGGAFYPRDQITLGRDECEL